MGGDGILLFVVDLVERTPFPATTAVMLPYDQAAQTEYHVLVMYYSVYEDHGFTPVRRRGEMCGGKKVSRTDGGINGVSRAFVLASRLGTHV